MKEYQLPVLKLINVILNLPPEEGAEKYIDLVISFHKGLLNSIMLAKFAIL